MFSLRDASTIICQRSITGDVCDTYTSLAELRSAASLPESSVNAREQAVKWLVLTTLVDPRAVDADYMGFSEYGSDEDRNYATSECTGVTLVIAVAVYDGDLVAAVNELTDIFNAVLGRTDVVTPLVLADR